MWFLNPTPWLPTKLTKAVEIDEPPTLYYIMKSIADFGKSYDEQTEIIKLAEATKDRFFYTDYPLAASVNKDQFEIDILNHFIYRRIGFDTVTGFKIALITKLREILPKYNLMFDLLAKEIELFHSNYERDLTEKTDDDHSNTGSKEYVQNGEYDKAGTEDITVTENTTKTTETESIGEGENSSSETGTLDRTTTGLRHEDMRESDTPQNALADVRNGSYVSKYNYNTIDTEETVDEDTSKSTTGTNTDTFGQTVEERGRKTTVTDRDWTEDGTDKTTYNEGTTDSGERDISHILNEKYKMADNLIEKMKTYANEIESVMSMIYKDLDCLFLQVYDY